MPNSERSPTPAQRARTVLTHASPLAVQIGGAEIGTAFADWVPVEVKASEEVSVAGVDADGSLVLMVGMDGALAGQLGGHAAPCVVHGAMVSPVPGPDRLLDRVTASGHVWLETDVSDAFAVIAAHRRSELASHTGASILLRVMIATIQLDGEPVDPMAYAGADPDPLAGVSNDFVEHLVSRHAREVLQIVHLLDPGIVRGMVACVPIRVDRFGITFRLDSLHGSTRARLDFRSEVHHPDELPAALEQLQATAACLSNCRFAGQPTARSTGNPDSPGDQHP